MSKPARGGLGKGLGALLPNAQGTAAKDKVHELDIASIQANRYQPRSDFQEEALEDLKDSIQQYGVLQPVLVRHLPTGGYELIAGERRFRAAKLAGLKTVPAILREYSDVEISEIALIENLQRENLNPVEEARAYDRLLADYGLTQEMLSHKVGRSRSHIANFLRLLKLPQRVQEYLIDGSLSMGQAKPLLALEDEELQLEAAEHIMAEELSARQTEALVKRLLHNPEYFSQQEAAEEKQAQEREIFVVEAEDRLRMLLGTQVKIRPGRKRSKIEIEFQSAEDLDRIIEVLTEKRQQDVEKRKSLLRQVSTQKNFSV